MTTAHARNRKFKILAGPSAERVSLDHATTLIKIHFPIFAPMPIFNKYTTKQIRARFYAYDHTHALILYICTCHSSPVCILGVVCTQGNTECVYVRLIIQALTYTHTPTLL